MTQLRTMPCPFCGSTEEIHVTKGKDSRYVECERCHATGPITPFTDETENDEDGSQWLSSWVDWNCRRSER